MIENILSNFKSLINKANDKKSLEEIKIAFLGKKGFITNLFADLKNLSGEEKKAFGNEINLARNRIEKEIEDKRQNFELIEINQKLSQETIDVTEPARKENLGTIHPLSKVMEEIENIFLEMGFEFSTGPEIEDDFHNFTALNMHENHPARQMQDTFYLKDSNLLLRTHTSNTQIRKMLNSKPPFRVGALGRVFRRDSDQTHTPMFHQFEGFVVDKNVTMCQLKWVLENFLKKFFNVSKVDLRFRPSFFPFTEPSAEVDISYNLEQGMIKIGAGKKFIEILGCGMIHPNVLKNCNIDTNEFQGFAFGIGVERLTMLKYGITDLRMLFENDIRFLNHFGKIK